MRTNTPIPKAIFPVVLVVFLFSLQAASAYYDPGVQRWLNRDPLSDHASLAGFTGAPLIVRAQADNVNEFIALRNAPVIRIDPDGRFVPIIPVVIAGGGAILLGGCSSGPPGCCMVSWKATQAESIPGGCVYNASFGYATPPAGTKGCCPATMKPGRYSVYTKEKCETVPAQISVWIEKPGDPPSGKNPNPVPK
jgi:hypothetical protein